MGIQRNKKKSPALFFLICFLVALIITIIANRQSSLVKEISIPLNNGITNLSTYGNLLVALSFDNKAYVLEWNNLSKKYLTIPVQFNQIVVLKNGTIVSVSNYNARSVGFTSIKDNTKKREIALNTGENKAFLKIGKNQNEPTLIVAQAKLDRPDQTTFSFYTIDPNKDFPQFESTIDLQIDINQRISAALSDDEKLVGLCGSKNNRCWIALCDTKEQKIIWESQLPEPPLFFNCEFTPDSKLIYARGGDSSVYKFDCTTGRMVAQLLPIKENSSTLKNQHVQSVQVSSDGSLLGAVVMDTVYIWDQATGTKIFGKKTGHKLVSSIAFSPDSNFLATADTRQGGKIKIWKIPNAKR